MAKAAIMELYNSESYDWVLGTKTFNEKGHITSKKKYGDHKFSTLKEAMSKMVDMAEVYSAKMDTKQFKRSWDAFFVVAYNKGTDEVHEMYPVKKAPVFESFRGLVKSMAENPCRLI